MKRILKKLPFYKEFRYIYRSFVIYKRPFSYSYYRFIVGPKIRQASKALDNPVGTDKYSVHLLCSHKDLLMMLWSLVSWHSVVSNSGQVYIHEDGSFTGQDKKIISQIFPRAKIIDFACASKQANRKWVRDYPKAREYRAKAVFDKKNIFAVKLIDPRFVGDTEIKLIIDTDLGWFKRPEEILDYINGSYLPFAINGTSSMDFTFRDKSTLDKSIAHLNSGIVGYALGNFKLENLEKFLSKVGDTNPHFIEQAGYTWVLSRDQSINFLPEAKYHIKGSVGDSTVTKHYTSPRREQFWFEGVKELHKIFL